MKPSTKKSLGILAIAIIVAVGLFARFFNAASLVASRQKQNDALIAEQLAYHVGVLAYLYGYPIVDMHTQMHNETHRVSEDQQVLAPVNRIYRFPNLVTPSTAGNLRAANNDTLYFTGWFDISKEPLIIHTPDTKGRYYTIMVANQYSEVVHIGRRTTGTEEGYFALVPPHWQGSLPAGVRAVPTETNQGWLLGRMLVEGPEDFDAAMGLVEEVWLAGLSEFTKGQRPPMPQVQPAEVSDPYESLEYFRVMNQQLRNLPPRPSEAALLAQFDAIGIGPSVEFDPDTVDAPTRKGLERALKDAGKVMGASLMRSISAFNGWMSSKDIGRYGYRYMHRASVAKGGYGNLPEESLYPATLLDKDGNLLSGGKRYTLRFEADHMPPVNGFWSLSVYNLRGFTLEPNEIERYSIGDRTKGLVYGEDGSLTIWLQHDNPEDAEKNWLPTPSGHFMAVIRMYEPAAAALDNSYLLPAIEKVD